jgi:hypothetical protein
MRKKIGILAALTLTFAAVASSATAPTDIGIPTTPACEAIVFIYQNGTAYECYCNRGTNCTPPAGVPHCTSEQCSVVVSG